MLNSYELFSDKYDGQTHYCDISLFIFHVLYNQNFCISTFFFLLRNVLISDMLRGLPETVLPKESKKLKKYKKESCLQDSPPAAGRFSDIIPFRRSAILPEGLCYVIGTLQSNFL